MNKEEIATPKEQEILPFDLETKKTILEIINDSPSLVKMGDKEFMVRNMRYYSVYRICQLVMDMKKEGGDLWQLIRQSISRQNRMEP